MRCSFNYPCHVGALMPDGDMTTMVFGCGEVIDVKCAVRTLEARTHNDFELEDGTVLVNVPNGALHYEPAYVPT